MLKRLEDEMPLIIEIIKASVNRKAAFEDVCNDVLHLHCNVARMFPTNEPHHWYDDIIPVSKFDYRIPGIAAGSVLCNVCFDVVNYSYKHPKRLEALIDSLVDGIEAKGGGVATLRVAGLSGIHVFCSAVISSLVLGGIIEVYDHFAKAKYAKYRTKQPRLSRMLTATRYVCEFHFF